MKDHKLSEPGKRNEAEDIAWARRRLESGEPLGLILAELYVLAWRRGQLSAVREQLRLLGRGHDK